MFNFEAASFTVSFRDIPKKNHFVTPAVDIDDSIKRKRIRVSPKKALCSLKYLTCRGDLTRQELVNGCRRRSAKKEMAEVLSELLNRPTQRDPVDSQTACHDLPSICTVPTKEEIRKAIIQL